MYRKSGSVPENLLSVIHINLKERVAGIRLILSGVDDRVLCLVWMLKIEQIDLYYFICTILRQLCGKI